MVAQLRVALVTGAARGQGLAIVRRLRRDGVAVAAGDVLVDELHDAVATAVAGALVLAALAVGVGLLLTRELLHGVIGRWDVDVTTWLVARRTPGRDDLSQLGSALAESATVIVVVALALALLAWRRHWQEFGSRTLADRRRHVHVGASLYHDIAPAVRLRLPNVWINRLDEHPGPSPTIELPDLEGLPDALDGLIS